MSNLPVVGQELQFNTGRGYSPEGQLIEARLVAIIPCDILGPEFPRLIAHFNDKTRGIIGECGVSTFDERGVLAAYDDCHNYVDITESEFGQWRGE